MSGPRILGLTNSPCSTPMINAVPLDKHEQGKIDTQLLKIKVKLAKDPAEYAVNNPKKKIGMLLGAKAGDIIWYFKTDEKKE
jgi:hypothetical protein